MPASQILIIDDDRSMRTVMRRTLALAGYEVIEAQDGQSGLLRFRENSPDLVITDIIMPEKEGLETMLELRHEFPRVKLIAISGGGRLHTQDYLKLARQFGACRTLAKPFLREEILAAVRDALAETDN